MLYLRTFGELSLETDGQPIVGGAAAQRGRLAILAVLAASGDRGVSRDLLLPLFWPESDEERARGALKQALYSLRRGTGHHDLLLGTTELRLNPRAIGSDIADFERYVAAGELNAAAAVYRGPFLAGIHLKGLEEFERWASHEQSRIDRQARTVHERMAAAAAAAGDWSAASDAWRKLAEADPLSAHYAAGLLRALVARGDRSGALRYASAFAETLHRELGIVPPESFLQAVQEIKRVAAATPPEPVAPVPHRDSGVPVAEVLARPSPRRTRVRLVTAATIAAAALAVTMTIALRRRQPDPVVDDDTILVAPFRTTEATASVRYLRDGMIDLLSISLSSDSTVRTIDPGRVLAAWRTDSTASAATRAIDGDSTVALARARTLGAGRVVVGSVMGTADHLMLTGSLLGVRDGRARAHAVQVGPVDSLPSMIDRLAATLQASELDPAVRTGGLSHVPLAALRAYIDGQSAFRRADYRSAARFDVAALGVDSTFALAALGLRVASGWIPDRIGQADADRAAWRWRRNLAPADAAYLTAIVGAEYPRRPSYAESLQAWNRAVRLGSERADAWFELGDIELHEANALGQPRGDSLARAAFERALQVDPEFVPALEHLVQLTARAGDTGAARRYLEQALKSHPQQGIANFLRWRVDHATGFVRFADARETADSADGVAARALAMTSLSDGIGLDDAERRLRGLLNHGASAEDRVDALLGLHALAMNGGHRSAAAALLRELPPVDPGRTDDALRLRLLDALYSVGDTAAADAAAAQLTSYVGPASGATGELLSDNRVLDECVLGQWWSARGDRAKSGRAKRALERAALHRTEEPTSVEAAVCAQLIGALDAVATNAANAATLAAAFDSTMMSGPQTTTLLESYAPLAIARLYERAGDRHRAFDAIRRRSYLFRWPRYLADELLEEARLAAVLGDHAGSRRAYAQFLTLRSAPDASLRQQTAEARGALAGAS